MDGSSPPNPFHRLLKLCHDVREGFTEDIGEFVEPTMNLVLDQIVCWVVDDYKHGCEKDITISVLYDPRRTGLQGWINWFNCIEYIDYYVPYMIMKVDQKHWPG